MAESAHPDTADAGPSGACDGATPAGRRWWVVVAIAWLATVGVSLALSAYTLDDSWITYRYSRNLVEGNGLKWNPTDDHAFEAYTSFAHVLLAAGMEALGVDPALGSKAMGVGFNLLLLALLARFCIKGGIPFPVFVGLAGAMAATHLYGFHAVSGMDTFLYVVVLTLTTTLLLHVLKTGQGLPAFCISLTLGALTRPDCAVLFAGYLLILWFLRPGLRRRLVRDLLLWTLIPGALYAGFKWTYFGSLLPNSFHFKASSSANGFLPGRVYVRQFVTAHLLVPLVFSAWLWRTRRLEREEFWCLASLAVAVLFYIGIRPKVGVGFRFLIPLLPSFLLVLSRPAGRLWSGGDRRVAGLYLLLLAGASLAGSLAAWPDLIRYLEPRLINPLIGRTLIGLPNSESRVLVTGEAGAIPYYSRTHHLDLLGLVSKTGAHSLTDATWVYTHHPEIIVTHSVVARPTANGGFELDRKDAARALAMPANNVAYLSYQVLTHPEAARFRLLWKVAGNPHPRPHEYYYLFVRDTSDLLPILTRRGRDIASPWPQPPGRAESGTSIGAVRKQPVGTRGG